MNNGTNGEVQNDKKKKKRKLIFAILLMSLALILSAGTLIAFFSDVIFNDTDVTTGRLDIAGEYTVTVNGTDAGANITNLTPGDVVVVTATVTNNGNLSAWVREVIDLDVDDDVFLDYLEIYSGSYTAAQLADNAQAGNLLAMTDGQSVTSARVLNGSGDDAQTESGGDFTYINSHTYQRSFTVHFLPEATNEVQNTGFGLRVTTQALQFANNNDDVPENAAWNSVTALA